jgi:hypothetical protein
LLREAGPSFVEVHLARAFNEEPQEHAPRGNVGRLLKEAFTAVRQPHEEPSGRNSAQGSGHVKKLSVEWFHGMILVDWTASDA